MILQYCFLEEIRKLDCMSFHPAEFTMTYGREQGIDRLSDYAFVLKAL